MSEQAKTLAQAARSASLRMAVLPSETKDRAIHAIADALADHREDILAANRADLAKAETDGLAAPLLKRLRFDDAKIRESAEGLRSLASLPDPVGVTTLHTILDQGLDLYRVTCPIGVIGVIFESRPDALVQISSLCLKSGDAVLLKGGSEALETNRALAGVIAGAAAAAGIPDGWIGLLESREDVRTILSMDQDIDLLIPRGSNAFVRHIMDHSRIPVLGHADGICHVYLDAAADPGMAVSVTVDSKTQYVAVCNACETLLVHAAAAPVLLPPVAAALRERGVTLLGCPRTVALVGCEPATEEDWRTEYLDYRLSVRIVDSLEEAVDHIHRYGSGHTEAIVTSDRDAAARFLSMVDAGNVFWNCSTRFSDGFRYGFGAEVGISTSRIHARGPVGLEGLVTYKYKVLGQGQTVSAYASGQKRFLHLADRPEKPPVQPCPL